MDWLVAGLDWAISQSTARPRQIVNISLGFCHNDPTLAQTVANAANAGILIVASAGNYQNEENETDACGQYAGSLDNLGSDWLTGVMWPARYSQVMAVSGILENDEFATAPLNTGGGVAPRPRGAAARAAHAVFPAGALTGHARDRRSPSQLPFFPTVWKHSVRTVGVVAPRCQRPTSQELRHSYGPTTRA